MTDPFVHRIDPVLLQIGGLCLWWYGLSYSLGFFQIHWFLSRRRTRLALSRQEVYALSLLVAIGVLLGGRAIEVLFDEWAFYREHAWLVPAYWLGGMATHGLLLGAALGLLVFTYAYDKPLLELADELVIPGALLMGLGRIGNFIDGQIVGSVTDVWWGIQFPDAAGVRHPVVLYDAAKNLLLVPFLLWVRRTNPTPGATAARFVFWYAFLRLFIDLFRDYPTHRLALGTGQTLNIVMALFGAVLLWRSHARRLGRFPARPPWPPATWPGTLDTPASWRQRAALAIVLLFCLTIPSNWTQDIPRRYGARHAGLEHSWLYPEIDTAPRGVSHRGTSSPGPPYTLPRGDPSAPLRSAFLTGGLRPPDPLTRSLAGTPPPRSARVARSLRSLAPWLHWLAALTGDFVPRTPLHAPSRGPLRPASAR